MFCASYWETNDQLHKQACVVAEPSMTPLRNAHVNPGILAHQGKRDEAAKVLEQVVATAEEFERHLIAIRALEAMLAAAVSTTQDKVNVSLASSTTTHWAYGRIKLACIAPDSSGRLGGDVDVVTLHP